MLESKYKKGMRGKLKNLGHLDDVQVEIVEVRVGPETGSTELTVVTTQCVGATPAGVKYDIYPYELKVE